MNKFDQYEVQAALQETAENFLNANFKRVNRLFYIKCILGVLLTFNIYLSHWYPIPWPKSYFLYIFCVVFYYAASYYYESLDIIPKSKGGFVDLSLFRSESMTRGTKLSGSTHWSSNRSAQK